MLLVIAHAVSAAIITQLPSVLLQPTIMRSPVLQAKEAGTSVREAATRVFSNASGSYSSNINLAVENSSWSDEMQLQEMYASRKSFAFDSDRCASPLVPQA